MTDERFFAILGRASTVFLHLCAAVVIGYGVWQTIAADQSYQHDTTPLLAPDTTRQAAK